MNPRSMRSSCRRSTFSTSAHSIASSMRRNRQTPSSSMPRGISVAGPHTPTSAPSFSSPQMFERATREWRISPTRQTFSPAILPCVSRMVRRSSSAWVGCSCLPSPALTTFERIRSPRNWAAPDEGCRITTMSIRIASRFFAVSTRVSPFCTALPDAATLTVSAERRFSANSKEMRVRVEASKNRLTIVLPRNAGTFLMGRSDTSLNGSAVSRIRRIWSGERCSSPTRSLPSTAVMRPLLGPRLKPRLGAYGWSRLSRRRRAASELADSRATPRHQLHQILPIDLLYQHVHALPAVHLHLLADNVRLDRQLATAAVDEHAQRNPFGAPKVRELVERGPNGAAGVQHVVHDHHVLAGEIAGDAGLSDDRLRAHGLEVVAIQGDVEGAAGDDHALVRLDLLGDPFGELHAAPLDADQDQLLGPVRQLEHLDRHTLKRPRQGTGVQDGRALGPAHLRLGR